MVAATSGHAAECGEPDFGDSGSYVTAIIKAVGKTKFTDDAGKAMSAYLLRGDEVVVMSHDGSKSCVAYENRKFDVTTGWISSASLGAAMSAVSAPKGWQGAFTADNYGTQIRLKPLKNGQVSADGEAYWANSPEAAQNGGLHDGAMSGEGIVKDGALHINSSSDGAPCKVDMRRLGRTYLIAEDNIVEQDGGPACGGANVSFTGLYVLGTK
ncbi:hypothetical protein [Aestuariivirga sp.]|uniref:hypothetical protein n=1 Tax=Aestuariivirga sp. TaxID=2650926 RepID=UPI0039E5ABCA